MLKVFEAFSGYGSQSISLKECGIPHEVVGISEIDPDAIIAYAAIRYDLENYKVDKTIEEIREELISKNVGFDFKKNKSKIPRMKKSKLELLYKADKLSKNLGDISLVEPIFLPDFDYFTYSFPCQDISVAGLGKGIKKGETRSGLLYECEKIIETNKPKYLLMENVKNLVGKKFKPDFDKWCEYLEDLGYKNFYKVLNAKDFGVAQNRERVFMISILDSNSSYIFSNGWILNKKLKDFLEDKVDEKYYLKDVKLNYSNTHNSNVLGKVEGTKKSAYNHSFDMSKRVYDTEKYAPSIRTFCEGGQEPKIAIPQATKKGYIEMDVGGVCDLTYPNSKTRRGRVQDNGNICPTLMRSRQDIVKIENTETLRIRKLTPKECFRLMGLKDEYIDRIQNTGLSNSAQYKLAGNSIVVNVLNEIHKELFKNNNY